MVAALLYSSREYAANRSASHEPANNTVDTTAVATATGPALIRGASTAAKSRVKGIGVCSISYAHSDVGAAAAAPVSSSC